MLCYEFHFSIFIHKIVKSFVQSFDSHCIEKLKYSKVTDSFDVSCIETPEVEECLLLSCKQTMII